jgi:putative FmdB family regulatory protein
MPIYEYKCDKCGEVVEVFHQALAQEPFPLCPACGSKNLTKLLSSPAIVKATDGSLPGTTCCGRTERCDTPPCSDDGVCRRDSE